MRRNTFIAVAVLAALASPLVLSPADAQQQQPMRRSGDGKNRDVTVVNDSTNRTIRIINFRQNPRNPWYGTDLLGDRTIVPRGDREKITIDDGTGSCYFQLRAVLDNMTEIVSTEMNVCSESWWQVWDSGSSTGGKNF